MTATKTTSQDIRRRDECSPADRVTKSLLGYGVIAGPVCVAVALARALTRGSLPTGAGSGRHHRTRRSLTASPAPSVLAHSDHRLSTSNSARTPANEQL
jgi:hypothetical protein